MSGKKARALRKKIKPTGRNRELRQVGASGQRVCVVLSRRVYREAKRHYGRLPARERRWL